MNNKKNICLICLILSISLIMSMCNVTNTKKLFTY